MHADFYGEKLYELVPPPFSYWKSAFVLLFAAATAVIVIVGAKELDAFTITFGVVFIVFLVVVVVAKYMYRDKINSSKLITVYENGVYLSWLGIFREACFITWEDLADVRIKEVRIQGGRYYFIVFYPRNIQKYGNNLEIRLAGVTSKERDQLCMMVEEKIEASKQIVGDVEQW